MQDLSGLAAWVGRTEVHEEVLAPGAVGAMNAMLDRQGDDPPAGFALPPLWHWLYFLPRYRTSECGPDGHARRGMFLPPVPLPRRMWAGGRVQFLDDLRIGERVRKVSTIQDVMVKEGKTGPLVFVVVRHDLLGPRGLAVAEEHDIVYRDIGLPGADTQPAPTDAHWTREVMPTPLLLFRYSALTFNGHRIHYDRTYCREVEGYPGLVVHGPLVATMLLDLLREEVPGRRVAQFEYRARAPLFDDAPFTVNGRREGKGRASLWAANDAGGLVMSASATFPEVVRQG